MSGELGLSKEPGPSNQAGTSQQEAAPSADSSLSTAEGTVPPPPPAATGAPTDGPLCVRRPLAIATRPELVWDVRVMVPAMSEPVYPREAPGRMYFPAYDVTTGAFVGLDAPVEFGTPANVCAALPQYRPWDLHPTLPAWCDSMAGGYRMEIPVTLAFASNRGPRPQSN